MRFGHGAIKDEFGIIVASRDGELCAVPAFAYPRQTTRATCLLGCLLLAILLDANHLLVDVLVKRTADGPIVWDGDLLPAGVVEVGSFGSDCGTFLEAPTGK